MGDGKGSVELETLIAYLSALSDLQGGKTYVNKEIQRTIDRIEEKISRLEAGNN